MLEICLKYGGNEIAPSTIFCYLMLNFPVKAGTRFSPGDKLLFEISEVKITRVESRLYEECYINECLVVCF